MQVYIGIDWSEKKHDVVFMNSAGALMAQFVMEHSATGFQKLDEMCRRLQVKAEECAVGLETAHTLLIDYLWSRNFGQVFVTPPSVVKSNRGRFSSSGSIDDVRAARLIAEMLRTDRGQLQPWHPDGLLTRQMRAKISLILHLTRANTRTSNRLRAVLLRYYPAALEVFKGGLGSQISLHFVISFPNPQVAAHLPYAQLKTFAEGHAYPLSRLPACWQRLRGDYPQASPETVSVYQDEAVLLAEQLLATRRKEEQQRRELYRLFEQHPDYALFHSLPGTGLFLAPALCAKFGDDRERFPDPQGVQALAGTCPVTEQSGKSRWVHFRWACDREWRYICQMWAKALVAHGESPLALAYLSKVRPHCKNESEAYRRLANRWVCVAWKVWQTQAPYDEAYHFQQVAERSKPRN